ncbi:MAG: hypothetical protein GY953_13730 [bacterium]|nr:hypothetical protein [bacterium]
MRTGPKPVGIDQKPRKGSAFIRGARVTRSSEAEYRAPRGEGAGVVVTALGFVPRVAALAVVTKSSARVSLDERLAGRKRGIPIR